MCIGRSSLCLERSHIPGHINWLGIKTVAICHFSFHCDVLFFHLVQFGQAMKFLHQLIHTIMLHHQRFIHQLHGYQLTSPKHIYTGVRGSLRSLISSCQYTLADGQYHLFWFKKKIQHIRYTEHFVILLLTYYTIINI